MQHIKVKGNAVCQHPSNVLQEVLIVAPMVNFAPMVKAPRAEFRAHARYIAPEPGELMEVARRI